MNFNPTERTIEQEVAVAVPHNNRFINWINDPMGMTIAASVLTISTFGIVLSGTWLVHLFVA